MSKKWATLFLTFDHSSLYTGPSLIPYYVNQHEGCYSRTRVHSNLAYLSPVEFVNN